MAALSRQMSRRSPSEDLERGGQKNEVMMIDIKMMGSTKKMQNYLGICGVGVFSIPIFVCKFIK